LSPARGADPAEAGPNVEPRQREHEARASEQRNDGDHVRRVAEEQTGSKRGHERGGAPSRREDEVGCDAKYPGGGIRQHYFLAKETKQIAIRLHERRSLPAKQVRLELAHVTREHRREG